MKKSFTLIELLVVIAIIGILAAIALPSLANVRAKARDARRLTDLDQMAKAMELYFSDYNHIIPFGPKAVFLMPLAVL